MSTTGKAPLSVCIISYNEADNIERTLECLMDLASEIILVDSHSTDQTQQIAASFGARIFVEDWKGHIRQKNSALEKCTQPWILAVDCDEVVSPELKASIRKTILRGEIKGYAMNRQTIYLGKRLNYTWQPDWKLRLVHRQLNPIWTGYDPHDILTVQGSSERLKGNLIHYSYRDLKDHMQRMVGYARTVAISYHKDGRKFHGHNLILNPIFSFIKKYFIKRAFLDGFQGFLVCASSFIYVFLKYAFLWEIEKSNIVNTTKTVDHSE
jgi:glycosyltransferase involved in cell wall biosynthesis